MSLNQDFGLVYWGFFMNLSFEVKVSLWTDFQPIFKMIFPNEFPKPWVMFSSIVFQIQTSILILDFELFELFLYIIGVGSVVSDGWLWILVYFGLFSFRSHFERKGSTFGVVFFELRKVAS